MDYQCVEVTQSVETEFSKRYLVSVLGLRHQGLDNFKQNRKMKNTFLLQAVIDDLVNTDKSLSPPLIKLNYFAKLIKN